MDVSGNLRDRRSAPTSRSRVSRRRPWTRAATAGAGAHVLYELVAGVAMPFASRWGPGAAAAFWASSTAAAFHQAGRRPAARDDVFGALNGLYLSAVIAHFLGWPRTTLMGLPWLTECEGLTGPVIAPYNVILHVSGIAAIGGLVETRRGAAWGALVLLLSVPWLLGEQRREFGRRVGQAQKHPAWWNRRLVTSPVAATRRSEDRGHVVASRP
ncbi:MAG TPA: hypothetical protein VGD12_14605 [Blastococcus sp.]